MTNKELELNSRLQRVMDNESEEVRLSNGKKFQIKRLTNYLATKIGKIITKGHISAENTSEDDLSQMFINMNDNRALAPKVCSIAILHNPVKVFLFHWVYWRWLSCNYEQRDFKVILEFIFGQNEISDFFYNVGSLRQNNLIATMIARKSPNTTTTEAEPDSESNPT